MDTLNSGFVSKKMDLNADVSFFKEAADIIDNEL